jgi:hypothetical protein
MPYLWLDSQHLFKGKQPASLTPKLLHMCMWCFFKHKLDFMCRTFHGLHRIMYHHSNFTSPCTEKKLIKWSVGKPMTKK